MDESSFSQDCPKPGHSCQSRLDILYPPGPLSSRAGIFLEVPHWTNQLLSLALPILPFCAAVPFRWNRFHIQPKYRPSRSYKSVKQCPCQNKAAEAPKNLAAPQVTEWPIEVLGWFALGSNNEDERRDDQCSDEIKYKTRIRF
jgi:hypothetical protein